MIFIVATSRICIYGRLFYLFGFYFIIWQQTWQGLGCSTASLFIILKSHLVLYLQDDAQQRYIDYVNDLAGGYLELLFDNELLVSPFSGALACKVCAAEHRL